MPTDSDPRPRTSPVVYRKLVWPIRQILPTRFDPPPPVSFVSVVEQRQSARILTPARLRDVISCISFATRTRAELVGDPYGRMKRPSMSAGALHPIHITIVTRKGAPRVLRFNTETTSLELLTVQDQAWLLKFLANCRSVLPDAAGTFIVLLAEVGKVKSNYWNAESLWWRDAGALFQTLHLTATSYRLGFCAMGILGGELIQALFKCDVPLQAVGVAVVGLPEI